MLLLHVNRDHDGDEDQEDPMSVGWYKLMLAQIVDRSIVRAEVLVVTVLVSPVRVVQVELGVLVGLEYVGVLQDTDEAVGQEVEVELEGVDYGCSFFARSNTTIKKHIQAYDSTVYLPRWT